MQDVIGKNHYIFLTMLVSRIKNIEKKIYILLVFYKKMQHK